MRHGSRSDSGSVWSGDLASEFAESHDHTERRTGQPVPASCPQYFRPRERASAGAIAPGTHCIHEWFKESESQPATGGTTITHPFRVRSQILCIQAGIDNKTSRLRRGALRRFQPLMDTDLKSPMGLFAGIARIGEEARIAKRLQVCVVGRLCKLACEIAGPHGPPNRPTGSRLLSSIFPPA